VNRLTHLDEGIDVDIQIHFDAIWDAMRKGLSDDVKIVVGPELIECEWEEYGVWSTHEECEN
jgi:hypothetical protein